MIEKKVKSSNVDTLMYDKETKTLTVVFLSGGVYEYYNVPEEIFQAIIDEKFTNQKGEPSVGGTLNKLVIKNSSYTWKKIN